EVARIGEQYCGEAFLEREARPFLIEEGGAMVAVDPAENFDLALRKRIEGGNAWYQVEDQEQWARVGVLVATRLEKGRGLGPSLAGRYQESILEEGELVAVRGVAATEPDLEAAPAHWRDIPYATILRGGAVEPLLISDEPIALE